ncbi:MAG: aminotransferase class IV [Planctomycetota bacterium]|nr:aminotransferase class IV [Planctomycetota bacterium]
MLVSLNGQLVPAARAHVSVFDRGFLFGDGVYEGIRVFDGLVRHLDDHCARLQQGLDEAGITWDAKQLHDLCPALLDANNLRDAFLYWQVTRGTPKPDHPVRARIAEADIEPTVFGYCLPTPGVETLTEPTECSGHTIRDDRWHKGHVKSVSLMANVIAAMDAARAGADEALFLRDGMLSESCSTNVFVALPAADGSTALVTPPVGDVSILSGVTRKVLLEICPEVQVRMVAEAELHHANEIFLVGTMTTVRSVTMLNGNPVGTGRIGPLARHVLDRYTAHIRAQLAARSTPR